MLMSMWSTRDNTLSRRATAPIMPQLQCMAAAAACAMTMVQGALSSPMDSLVNVVFPPGTEELFEIHIDGTKWFQNEAPWFLVGCRVHCLV